MKKTTQTILLLSFLILTIPDYCFGQTEKILQKTAFDIKVNSVTKVKATPINLVAVGGLATELANPTISNLTLGKFDPDAANIFNFNNEYELRMNVGGNIIRLSGEITQIKEVNDGSGDIIATGWVTNNDTKDILIAKFNSIGAVIYCYGIDLGKQRDEVGLGIDDLIYEFPLTNHFDDHGIITGYAKDKLNNPNLFVLKFDLATCITFVNVDLITFPPTSFQSGPRNTIGVIGEKVKLLQRSNANFTDIYLVGHFIYDPLEGGGDYGLSKGGGFIFRISFDNTKTTKINYEEIITFANQTENTIRFYNLSMKTAGEDDNIIICGESGLMQIPPPYVDYTPQLTKPIMLSINRHFNLGINVNWFYTYPSWTSHIGRLNEIELYNDQVITGVGYRINVPPTDSKTSLFGVFDYNSGINLFKSEIGKTNSGSNDKFQLNSLCVTNNPAPSNSIVGGGSLNLLNLSQQVGYTIGAKVNLFTDIQLDACYTNSTIPPLPGLVNYINEEPIENKFYNVTRLINDLITVTPNLLSNITDCLNDIEEALLKTKSKDESNYNKPINDFIIVKDNVQILTNNSKEKTRFRIMDNLGKIVLEIELSSNESFELNENSLYLSKGIYYLFVNDIYNEKIALL